MVTRVVQTYGQVNLGKLAAPLGFLVSISVIRDESNVPFGLLAQPYCPGDETKPELDVKRISDNRLTVPAKFRRLVGIGKYCHLCPAEDRRILILPYSIDQSSVKKILDIH